MKKSYFKMLIGMLIYGSVGLFSRMISLKSTQIILIRAILGALTLWGVTLLTNTKIRYSDIKKNKIPLFLGALGQAAGWSFLFEAFNNIDISIAIVLHYLGPVIIILLSPIVLKEKLSFNKIISILLAIVGMILINGTSISGQNPKWGVIAAILSAFFYALSVMANKFIKDIESIVSISIQLTISSIIMIVYTWIVGDLFFNIPERTDLVLLLILGVVHTAFAGYLHLSSVQDLKGQTVALLGYIDPVSAVIFSAIFLNERMSFIQILGTFLIIGGAIYGELSKEKRLFKT